jgi:hypothetical protein
VTNMKVTVRLGESGCGFAAVYVARAFNDVVNRLNGRPALSLWFRLFPIGFDDIWLSSPHLSDSGFRLAGYFA